MKTCLLCKDPCESAFTIISPQKQILQLCESCMEDFFRFVSDGQAEEYRMNPNKDRTSTSKLVNVTASSGVNFSAKDLEDFADTLRLNFAHLLPSIRKTHKINPKISET